MKGRIIRLIICLAIGGLIAVYLVNPWQATETAKNMSYVVKTDNNWFYVVSQLALMASFIMMGFLYGVKHGRKTTERNP
jgi:hypothetical protein